MKRTASPFDRRRCPTWENVGCRRLNTDPSRRSKSAPAPLWGLDGLRCADAVGDGHLMAAIDCCTREIVGWHLELRCLATESIGLVERAAVARQLAPGTLTLGTDNGSAVTARALKLALSGLGFAHRRGGYRDPESHVFIESWFGAQAPRGPAQRLPDPLPGPRQEPTSSATTTDATNSSATAPPRSVRQILGRCQEPETLRNQAALAVNDQGVQATSWSRVRVSSDCPPGTKIRNELQAR